MIELVPCSKDRDFYICLAQEYIKDLQKYDKRIIWSEEIWDKGIWDARFIVDGAVLCGFVCVSEISFKNKPKLMFIDEFYISPNERRRKVGVEGVRELTKNWNGDVGMYILEKNEVAKAFWKAVEKELEWNRIERDDIRQENGCELRVYRT